MRMKLTDIETLSYQINNEYGDAVSLNELHDDSEKFNQNIDDIKKCESKIHFNVLMTISNHNKVIAFLDII